MTEIPLRDVIVVGAGIAGLSATRALRAAGLDVVCLEARDRVGGRLLTARTDDGPLDLGATWYWPGERRVSDLLTGLGMTGFASHTTGDALFDHPGGVERLTGNPFGAPSLRYGGGAALLADRSAAALPAGTVHLDTPVSAIGPHPRGLVVRTPSGELPAAHVVLAVPPALAAARVAFPAGVPASLLRLAAATPVWMGPVAKVVARYRTPFWRERGLSGAAFSGTGPLREIHDLSGPGGSPAALFGFAQGGPAGSERALADRATRQLVRLFGERAGDPVEMVVQDWSRQEWTSPPGVGRLGDHALYGHPHYRRPALDGRLHWASTETATEYAGHVEGALAAAEDAVAAVLHATHAAASAAHASAHAPATVTVTSGRKDN
ncbi:flavin monoamine oxidase family protein [Streptomyces liangshanensis]|uniref:flavin monoamine oxidase family protein n=1 Tax=Streptomyces liangshanensis TaxID=2717324 RepID=UPI0036DE0673